MSAQGFKSVVGVGMVASAALGCYLISLTVASQRAALESVETEILMTQRDIRSLETEIGTRGRLAQLERWNARVIQLSAPNADQFVEGGFQLATLVKPAPRPAIEAPVVLASVPRPEPRAMLTSDEDGPAAQPPTASRPLGEMMHVASYSRPAKPEPRKPEPLSPVKPKAASASPATKPVKTATADPLAALPGGAAKAKGGSAPSGTTAKHTIKETGSH